MNKLPLTLDLDALRSFVTGIECGSFAQAANRLCRSTSAVSAQLKKLEQQCGTELVVKKGRHLELTHHGEIIMGYARRLLVLNDEALRALNGERLQGEIRIGMQEDFGESLMPGILGEFKRHHPGMRMIARVDRNRALLEALNNNALDMALLWQPESAQRDGRLIAQCPLEWIRHPKLDIGTLLAQGKPLPLVMLESPCLMRSRAIDCLDRANIAWQVVFVSHSLSGIWAALQAGLGITVRTRIGMPGNLRVAGSMLPSPGNLGITLEQVPGNDAIHGARALLGQLMEETLLNAM
ncbi:LysR substrate-binding domain-containing protein [Klebsiella pasteurii]|uniref:LysR substrate-binding domain-containing protein n=1 Tax=Klebsiella pasteurii TaxID=2587529 RepID=A0ABD5HLT4_9ENTR|nr:MULTISPECIES: LysR substrate-binding domain-containing protein [Klebsiella]PLM00333.1 LysR family transcriptional regulator [Klebsiella michiganensis]MDD9664773.1 LysR substrate-binding domain-containing protein [Klebsiella pasteurii]MDD9670500.1 LysR substrate-binding domain-containing protein [Klebsiella pasteurii]MDD9686352.1 LysR substrate-binding domain-containing protein [Klebsiella pasteurii]MDH0312958.1 LysR substrate-binding domain-containing protein [Klebsiella pasteurii]